MGTKNFNFTYLPANSAQPEVYVDEALDQIDEQIALSAGSIDVEAVGESPGFATTKLAFQGATVSQESDGRTVVTIDASSGGGGSGGGGSPVSVSDGTTTVSDVTEILFSGAFVTASGSTAEVAVGGGGSLIVSDGTTTLGGISSIKFSGATLSAGAGGDAHFSEVSTLLHMDAGALATDSSATPLTWTNSGVLSNTTDPDMYGTGCGEFASVAGGTSFGGAMTIAATTSGALDLGTGDFTVEIRWKPRTGAADGIVFATTYINHFIVGGSSSNSELNATVEGVSLGTSGACITLDAWNHIALVMESDVPSVYANGNRVLTGSAVTRSAYSSQTLYIGGTQYGPSFAGLAEEFRVTKVARYSGTTYTVPTAAFPNDSGDQAQITISASGGGNVTADSHPSSPDPVDDEFEGTTLDSKWTWVNQLAATANLVNGSLVLVGDGSSGTTNFNYIEQPIVGSTWEYTCALAAGYLNYGEVGMLVANGSGNFLSFEITMDGTPGYIVQNFTNPTTYAGSTIALYGNIFQGNANGTIKSYLRLAWDGTDFKFSISFSGIPGTFVQLISFAPGSYFSGTPASIGLCVNSKSSNPVVGAFDWFRKTG